MAMQPHRRKGGRGSDYGRRDQAWGSPRSGSPGSPTINGSPRSARRREAGHPSELDQYTRFLGDLWHSVERDLNENPGKVTIFTLKEFNPGNQEGPYSTFDVDGFFADLNKTFYQQSSHYHPNLMQGVGSYQGTQPTPNQQLKS
ncbi:uncharacterized protein LOC116616596 isoform X2 [Nematostella vectensis]|uniref:uncharacterized protein LOC116616596 isoform X1 n=1 Tax=Nematostella vectensis TaxID=45351 RepID=UPI002077978B|nr:uncharacterized protein LOC116616596 isoform X1 [Nematostella vectensis]XP_048575580.1 uncharacterized protein LOC116616596 isoform X2 [Nematostella vectensis]